MKRRSGVTVMARLIGLVRPLTGFMMIAVSMGLIGHLLAAFITILGGYAALGLLGVDTAGRYWEKRRSCLGKTVLLTRQDFNSLRRRFRNITGTRKKELILIPSFPAGAM